ncbi:acylphosphatase [Fulvimonas yonginensis]|uniref:acylphosphatase n=1 Tax=Fulvimonas yonginensis TaxID=1495200 RepID=A0ABU8J9P2_9GAMM
MAAARFLISGRVQGVFYRAGARNEALRLGLTGHARNLPDGCVEVVAHGEPAALDALERWLWQGPPAAKVDRVERSTCAGEAPRGFVTG